GSVDAIAAGGGRVYAGGGFSSMGGVARHNVAALDVASGAATAWDPNANDIVSALTTSGGTVYAGGRFTTIGGQSRSRIAALDATTGAATAWDPSTQSSFATNPYPEVDALLVSGSTLYAGGAFTG